MYPGIFPDAVGYVCRVYALSCIAGLIAASFLYLVPLLAAVIAWFWPGEAPAPLKVDLLDLRDLGVVTWLSHGHETLSSLNALPVFHPESPD